jgi:di/tricarboxylate transporter
MDRDQRIVALTMTATIGLWLVGSVTGLSTIVPPLLAVAVLTAPGVRILEASDIRRVNWNILLLFGAIMSLIAALQSTGALMMVIDAVLDVVPLVTLPTAAAVAMVLAGVVLIRLFFSTASAPLAIMLPVVITVAGTLGVDPLAFSLATVLIVGSTTLVPFHLPPVLLVAEHYKPLRVRDVLVVGLISFAAATVVTAGTWLVVWSAIGLS